MSSRPVPILSVSWDKVSWTLYTYYSKNMTDSEKLSRAMNLNRMNWLIMLSNGQAYTV